jgi:hypothetical protein
VTAEDREKRHKAIDSLARCHADACRVGDRELARMLVRMMARHCRALNRYGAVP